MDPGSRFLQHVWKRQFFTSTKAFQKEGRHAGQGRDVKEANVCGCGRGGSLRFVPLHSSLTASQWCYETPSPPCCYHHSHQGKKIVYFLRCSPHIFTKKWKQIMNSEFSQCYLFVILFSSKAKQSVWCKNFGLKIQKI